MPQGSNVYNLPDQAPIMCIQFKTVLQICRLDGYTDKGDYGDCADYVIFIV